MQYPRLVKGVRLRPMQTTKLGPVAIPRFEYSGIHGKERATCCSWLRVRSWVVRVFRNDMQVANASLILIWMYQPCGDM